MEGIGNGHGENQNEYGQHRAKAKDCNSDHRMCICSVDHDKQLYFLEYEKTK